MMRRVSRSHTQSHGAERVRTAHDDEHPPRYTHLLAPWPLLRGPTARQVLLLEQAAAPPHPCTHG
jgi:hypothetical protein